MPKRGRTSKSIFSSLPEDLRRAFRSKSRDATSSTRVIKVSVEPVHDVLAAAGCATPGDLLSAGDFLSTQPESASDDDGGDGESRDMEIDREREGNNVRADSGIQVRVTKDSATVVLDPPISPNTRRRIAIHDLEVGPGICSDLIPVSSSKKGKKKLKAKALANEYIDHPYDCTGLVPRYTEPWQVPEDLKKYFYQRALLFPQYDTLPLLLDRTGWFSVTPQPIAAHIAQRCRCDVIVDAFCGVGGNTIAFAQTCERVIAIDNDITRLKLARHNALHHGVAHRIEFILGDYIDWARSFSKSNTKETIDVVFLSPPWGGIDYLNTQDPTFRLSAILPIHGRELFELTSTLTPNIAYYLPRNTNLAEVGELARKLDYPPGRQAGEGGDAIEREWVEVEEETVRSKVKALTVYYGGLVQDE